MCEEVIQSEEEIKNIIAENCRLDTEVAEAYNRGRYDLGQELFCSMFPGDDGFSVIKERAYSRSKKYWTVSDIARICVYFDMDCIERYSEKISHQNIEGYKEWLKRAERSISDLICSGIRDTSLTVGKDVFIHGKNFGEDPRDAVYSFAFIKLLDRTNKIFKRFSIIKIPDDVREAVKECEMRDIAAQKLSDGEILLAYFKSKFMEDIDKGTSKDRLLSKFLKEGQLDSDGVQEYYKYKVDGREIRISKDCVKHIVSVLVDPEPKESKKAA